jgi:hypothetical protein
MFLISKKFQNNKSWETSLRLKTWVKRSLQFNQKPSQTEAPKTQAELTFEEQAKQAAENWVNKYKKP